MSGMLRRKKGSVLDLEGERRKLQEQEKEAREKEEFEAKLRLSVDRKDVGNITAIRGKEQDVVETLQSNTFSKWANLILASDGGEALEDAVNGLKKGENLCRLLTALSGKSVVAPKSGKGYVQTLK